VGARPVSGKIPERIRWAVETLDIKGSERVLEIGGGPGVAASIICERLETGFGDEAVVGFECDSRTAEEYAKS
jgi:protein-L-isoaspartate O-methyltransferase